MINVSRVVLNPKFLEEVTIISRKEEVNDFGESILTTNEHIIMALVTSPRDDQQIRTESSTNYSRDINVSSASRLTPDTFNRQPDLVLWKGNYYIVKAVDDYSSFGYFRALASLTDYQVNRRGC